MISEREVDSEVVEPAPAAKPGITVVVILSILIGVLLTVMVVGAFFYYQRSSELQSEVRSARDELKGKSVALDEMRAQIEALSRQIFALKEYSIARSSSGKASGKEAAAPPASGGTEPGPPAAAETSKATASPAAEASKPDTAPLPPVRKVKAKPAGQSCELAGKSAEEQAAILKRCVNLMDSSGEKPRAR